MARRARGGRKGDYEHKVLIWSRPPAILKVNCPEGAREGGLGHWLGKKLAAGAAKLPCNRNLYLTLGMSNIRPVGSVPSSSWLAWRICSMVVP